MCTLFYTSLKLITIHSANGKKLKELDDQLDKGDKGYLTKYILQMTDDNLSFPVLIIFLEITIKLEILNRNLLGILKT